MSAPDRPTREQVEAIPHKAAALLLAAARPDPTLRTAARQVQDALIALDTEVRALRADVETFTKACDEYRADLAVKTGQLNAARRAALAARTPQPAPVEVTRGGRAIWSGEDWTVEQTEGGEVAVHVSDHRDPPGGASYVFEADLAAAIGAAAPVAPLSAVPDGERGYHQLTEQEGGPPNERYPDRTAPESVVGPDGEGGPAFALPTTTALTDRKIAIVELRGLTQCRCDRAWRDRGLHERLAGCASEYRKDVDILASAAPSFDGGDVPARLDAAAAALGAISPAWETAADYFRMAAEELREGLWPEAGRAAVAAALSLPTEPKR